MAKRNKLRYQSQGNQFPPIILTGRVYLRHVDEEAIASAAKGDLQIYLSTDINPYAQVGNYEAMGMEGYLKAEVFDGKVDARVPGIGWKPVSLEEFFENREYYYGKRERPIDTYNICVGILQSAAGAELIRTYREHYVKVEPRAETNDETS